MDRTRLESYLKNAISPDFKLRKEAEDNIMKMQSSDFGGFLMGCTEIFCDEKTENQLKTISGIILKNSLHANDLGLQEECKKRWFSISLANRESLKKIFIKYLDRENQKFAVLTGGILGQIARIEISENMYLEFFQEIKELIADTKRTTGACEALGICCNYLIEETDISFNEFSDYILSSCLIPLQRENDSLENKAAALKCIMNSMEAMEVSFRSRDKVGAILKILLSPIKNDEEVEENYLVCINRLVVLFYEKAYAFIDEIVKFYEKYFSHQNQNLRIQAIEFWTIVSKKKDDTTIRKYRGVVIKEILKQLEKDEDFVEESWSPHKAAASCLESFTKLLGKEIINDQNVSEYLKIHLNTVDDKKLDLGAIALGSVVCEGIDDYLVNIIPQLLNGVDYKQSKDSCLWALSKIAELNFYAAAANLPTLITKAGNTVMENNISSIGAAWVLDCLFVGIAKIDEDNKSQSAVGPQTKKEADEAIKGFIATRYIEILNMMVKATEEVKLDDSNLRIALFSALSTFITICPPQQKQVMNQFFVYITQRINECLGVIGKASQNKLLIVEDVLSNYIALIEVVAVAGDSENIDNLLPILISILDSRPTLAYGEVYMAITNLCDKYKKKANVLLKYIVRDLSILDPFILKSVLNLIGTLANAMGKDFSSISETIISTLVNVIRANNTPKPLIPLVIDIFGDMALALEDKYEPYLDLTVLMLSQIVGFKRSSDEQFVDEIRQHAVQLFDCVLLSLGDIPSTRAKMSNMINLLHHIVVEDAEYKCRKGCVNLIDDLVNMYGKAFGLDSHWVVDFLYGALRSTDDETRKRADHALSNLQ